jgi:NAD(P)-dependent dehydrogenase (short-subunit alcohol dehydrogenase family)
MRFQGKVAIVTGGGDGIGRATAIRLAAEGAAVMVFDINPAGAEATVGAVHAAGGTALAHAGSVTSEADIAAGLAATVDKFGKLDVLVNNAGFALTATLSDLDAAYWDREFDGNVKGAWLWARAAMPVLMQAGGRGNIVNIGSVNGLMYFGNPAYSAAKAALLSLTKSLAVEYGPRGVRTNMVSPGTIQTGAEAWTKRIKRDPKIFEKLSRWYPVGRVGKPEDIAAAVCYLAADEAGFCNGTNLVVDGGLTAGMPIMAEELLAERESAPTTSKATP